MNGVCVGWWENGQCVDWGREGLQSLANCTLIYVFFRLCFFLFVFISYILPYFLCAWWLIFLLSLYVFFLFYICPELFIYLFFPSVFLSFAVLFPPFILRSFLILFFPIFFFLVYLQAICFLQNSRFLGQNTTVISKQISYVSAAVSSHHQADRSEEYRKE
jgi:hypothetical protein